MTAAAPDLAQPRPVLGGPAAVPRISQGDAQIPR
jgi:hypothetical protein